MSPGHPTHVRKLARAASFVMSTNQSGKPKTLDRCLFHPCKKEGAKLPDSGRGLRTRRHSGSQTSPSEHKAAGYGNFPWQPDMPFTKAGELTAFCHSSVLASSQRLFVPRRAEEADHPEEQRAGGQPRLRAGAALLGSRLFPENPYQAFSFKTLSKILCSLGTAHHSMALEPDPPLHYSTGHSSREWLYSNSWETERKSNGWPDTHHLLRTVFWYRVQPCCWM